MKLLPLLLSGALLLAATPRSHGQDIGPALNMNLMTGWAGGEAVRFDLEKRAAAKGSRSATTKAAPSFAYRPSPAMREQTVARAVARLQPQNPTGAQVLNDVFGPGKYDYDKTYAGIISGTGLRATDAADALACYLLMGYAIVHNLQDEKAITPVMATGVRSQVLGILASNPSIKATDPVAAARLGEDFKLQTVILQGGWQSAIKENNLPAYQQSISQLFRSQYGLDMSQVKLTSAGLAKR